VSVSPAANSNGWVHLAWVAKAVSATNSSYYLYANGQLVAAQLPTGGSAGTLLPFNVYYDGSPQRVGVMFQVNDFNNKLFFSEVQVYAVPNGDDAAGGNGAALYLGGNCTGFQSKYAAPAGLLSSTFAQAPDVAHRFALSAPNVLGTSPLSAATMTDSHPSVNGNPSWNVSAATSGALSTWLNQYGVNDIGVPLSSASVYVDLGARDYGLLALNATDGLNASAPGVSFSFWLTRTAATAGSAATRLATIVGNTYDDYSYTIALTPRGGATAHTVDVSWPACQGDAAFVSVLPNGTLNTPGTHHVLVSHSSLSSMQVRGRAAPF